MFKDNLSVVQSCNIHQQIMHYVGRIFFFCKGYVEVTGTSYFIETVQFQYL